MKVYFMRHGETDWNTVKRLQGTTDIPLNENGISLARISAENMKNAGIQFDEIFSSPLNRAVHTAEIINEKYSCTIKTDERIKEFNFGQAEGHTFDEVKTSPEFISVRNWFLNPSEYTAALGAESYETFFGRLRNFLDEEILPLENKMDSVLIVCHGGVVRGLLKVMLEWSIEKFADTKIPNCGVNLVNLKDGKFSLEYTAKTFY